MRMLVGMIAVLALASAATAEPTFRITAPRYDGDLMYVDLITVDTSGYDDWIYVFNSRAILGGADAARFDAYPFLVRRMMGDEIEALIAPAAFAWGPYCVTAAMARDPSWLAFGVTLSPRHVLTLASIPAGAVVGRYYFRDQMFGTPLTELRIHMTDYAGTHPRPTFYLQDGVQKIDGIVLNDNQNLVPEPATVGLLGLGLAGAAFRRLRRSGRATGSAARARRVGA